MLKSYLGPMFVTFFIVMFILLMNVLWMFVDELVGKGLPLSVILELLFFAASMLMPLGLPLSTLFAAIMTMGNLGENNELLALKAAGVSLFRIMKPIIFVAVIISIASFFLTNNYLPYAYQQMKIIRSDIKQLKGEIEFKDGVFFNSIPNISIRVGKQDPVTNKLTDVLIYDTRDANSTKTIVADSGYMNLSMDKKFLKIVLYNGQNYADKRNWEWYTKPVMEHHIFDYEEMLMEIEGFSFERNDSLTFNDEPKSKNITQLSKDIDSLQIVTDNKLHEFVSKLLKEKITSGDSTEYTMLHNDSIAALKHHMVNVNSYFDTLPITEKSKLFDNINSKLRDMKYYVTREHGDIRATSMRLYETGLGWHEKVALPISVLIFFLIGAPLGAIIRKGGLGLPVVISVMFFIIYYIISLTGAKMVKDGIWSPLLGQWLSSMMLFPIAMFLCYKSATDSQLFNKEAYLMRVDKIKEKIKKIKQNVKAKHN